MKYRKKPVVIDAECWTDWDKPPTGVARSQIYEGVGFVASLEGPMGCRIGDWIITGVNGDQYPCKPSIFEATYERVEEPE